MDFISRLPKSQTYDTVMVVDRLTKYSYFIPLSHPFTGKEVAKLFTEEVLNYKGFLNQ